MIFVVTRLFDIDVGMVFCDFEQFPVEVFPDLVGDNRVSVFGRTH